MLFKDLRVHKRWPNNPDSRRAPGGPAGGVLLAMDQATPERKAGAAQITLARYTHALPEDILKARDTLKAHDAPAAYLAENQKARAAR
jgi:hypothetical protein